MTICESNFDTLMADDNSVVVRLDDISAAVIDESADDRWAVIITLKNSMNVHINETSEESAKGSILKIAEWVTNH